MCLWLPAYSRTALPSKPILSPKWYLCYINGASIHVTVVCIRSGHLIWANKSEPSPWFRNSEQWVSDMKGCVDSGLRALSEPWWVIREIFLWEKQKSEADMGRGGTIVSPVKNGESWENDLAFWDQPVLSALCLNSWELQIPALSPANAPPLPWRAYTILSSPLHAHREAVIKTLHFSRKWSTSGAYKCFCSHIAEFWKPTIPAHFLVDNLQVLFSFCGGGRNLLLLPRFLQLVQQPHRYGTG